MDFDDVRMEEPRLTLQFQQNQLIIPSDRNQLYV